MWSLLAATSRAETTAAQAEIAARVEARLDAFHAAAAGAQFEAYFSCFTSDGVFIGTDATERWTVEQFKVYAKRAFDAGRGWTYVPTERHVVAAPDGTHASFDELLQNAKLGLCRGTGVLRLVEGEWKVAQYVLTIPIPNALAGEVVKRIREEG